MLYKRGYAIAGAGTNTVYLDLSEGNVIKHIAARNNTKGWQMIAVELVATGQDLTAGVLDSIVYFVRQNQVGWRDALWQGRDVLTSPFTRLVFRFMGCDAGDELYYNVGYHQVPDETTILQPEYAGHYGARKRPTPDPIMR